MVYIITDMGYGAVRSCYGNRIMLNCMNTCAKKAKSVSAKKNFYNPETIQKNIEHSAKVKQQLEAANFERDKRILQSVEARKKI